MGNFNRAVSIVVYDDMSLRVKVLYPKQGSPSCKKLLTISVWKGVFSGMHITSTSAYQDCTIKHCTIDCAQTQPFRHIDVIAAELYFVPLALDICRTSEFEI